MNSLSQPPRNFRPRVLIVDDDTRIRDILTFYFEALDCDVLVCGSVAEAFKILEIRNFDLVVVDLFMGDGLGLEVLAWVQQNRPECPTVLTSGSDDQDTIDQAWKLGIVEFWRKPTRIQDARELCLRLWDRDQRPPPRGSSEMDDEARASTRCGAAANFSLANETAAGRYRTRSSATSA